jgi:methionyl-tRNA formyltransferase
MALRIVFCGTPSFALPAFRHLIAQPDFQIESVVTQPDRPRGRGGEVVSPVMKVAALEAGIGVYQPERIKSDSARDFFQRVAPDAVVIIAYGQIVPQHLIDIPRLGWINLHASLLPKYRGAAPIQWAIVNGETRTGVTTMQIDAGLDTGPVLLQRETMIARDETAPQLSAALAELGAPLVAETLRGLAAGTLAPKPQDHSKATLARPLKKEDGLIHWSFPAPMIYARVRGLDPWPGAYTTFRGVKCRIWGKPILPISAGGIPGILMPTREDGLLVICGEGTVFRVEYVQREGRKRISDREFMSGARVEPGERFGE